jgi:hypothetical protein
VLTLESAAYNIQTAMLKFSERPVRMKKFWGYVGAVLAGSAFIGIGYAIYSGNPLPDQNITYGGIEPNEVQAWLINKFGEAGTGLSLIFIGVGLACWCIWQGHRTAK